MSATHDRLDAWNRGGALRRIGLLAGAVFVAAILLCGTASSASAVEQVGLYVAGEESEEVAKQPRFEAEKYTATVKGTGQTHAKFTIKNGYLECYNSSFSGSISAATSSLSLSPSYNSCLMVAFGLAFEVDMNISTCAYELDLLNAGPPYVGDFGLNCSSGLYGFTIKNAGKPLCTITYPNQSGVEGISFANLGSGKTREIDANFTLSGLKYTMSNSASPFCKNGEYEDGTFTVDALLRAEK